MLQGLRNAGQSWLGKIIVGVLFGLLIISFAIWGIGDIFRGNVRTTVATVGDTEISAEAVRQAYQNEIQRLSRQLRQSITPETARALGIDTQVLGRLVTEASLDQRANDLGLNVSDQLVARSIVENPAFHGSDGVFNRALFDEILRSSGLSEAGFVREQRAVIARQQLADALSAALPVPVAMREAAHRYGAERRGATYVVLPATLAGEIPAPTDEQLQTFYEERKATFRAPEYRAINVLALSPEAIAKPGEVSDADARQRYEQVKAARFGTPERRRIQQLTFPTLEEARAARERITGGATFEAIAAERNVAPAELELGTFTRSELVDPAVADAAFALAEGAVSEPVQGRFGPVLLRVTDIEAESVRPFDEVAGEIKREIALERARDQLNDVFDQVEDQRAAARPLAEIARERGMTLLTIPAIDRTGRDKAGVAVPGIPEGNALVNAAFASDIGVDNEALRTRAGGYVWYEVANIEPARDRPLAEVRDEVAAQWRAEEVSRRLAAKARTIVERLNQGEVIDVVAGELGVPVETATDLARGEAKGALSSDVVRQIFAVPVGKAGTAALGDDRRVVFRVDSATVPPFLTTTQDAERLEERLRAALTEDLLAQYIAQVQQDVGVAVNQQALRRAIGGEI